MKNGRVVRFDEVRGYGFVTPDDGGEDVFIHANVLDGDKWALAPGVPVEFEAVDSDRGPKAVLLRIVPGGSRGVENERTSAHAVAMGQTTDDEEIYDVLSERALTGELTELLLGAVPDLTGAQLLKVRQRVLELARQHGWVEG